MDRYGSYLTPQVVISETVFQFIRGATFGAVFGMVRVQIQIECSFFRVPQNECCFNERRPFSGLTLDDAPTGVLSQSPFIIPLTKHHLYFFLPHPGHTLSSTRKSRCTVGSQDWCVQTSSSLFIIPSHTYQCCNRRWHSGDTETNQ
jgi:hypothetical protein